MLHLQPKGVNMKKTIRVLSKAELFKGIKSEDIELILVCLAAESREYRGGEIIYSEGDRIEKIGLVLSGKVHLIRESYDGDINILGRVGLGDLFGESFAFGKIEAIPISAYSEEDSKILFIDYRKIINTCSSSCDFHNKLIFNMMHILSRKNILLNEKNLILGEKTIRQKLESYLSLEAKKNKVNEFHIGFDRQGLADYLSINRSAMSRELSKMEKEGLISYKKNYFKINK